MTVQCANVNATDGWCSGCHVERDHKPVGENTPWQQLSGWAHWIINVIIIVCWHDCHLTWRISQVWQSILDEIL